MTQTILITGASGYTGERLCRRLASRHRVVGTFLSSPVNAPQIEAVPVDLREASTVARLVRDLRPDVVIHTAAITKTGFCQTDPESARAGIVTATQSICAALRKHSPQIPLIGFSTDLVFDGENPPYPEAAPTKPLMVYGSLKAEAEGLILDLPEGVILRPALIYGPPNRWRKTFLSWMVETLQERKPLTLFSDEVRTPVFIEDLLDAVEILLRRTPDYPHRIFHAGGPQRLNRVEMGRRTCQTFGLPEELIRPVSLSEAELKTPRPRDVSLQCEALRQLGWKPGSFKEGLEESRQNWTKT